MFGRFEVLEPLGRGGYGDVVRALDTETSSIVAIKLLSRVEPEALLSFKHEFRTLADVHHPHLVRLGELLESDGLWGFSMEYVPGTDFTSWVRPDGTTFHEGRLRRGLAQLARGLMALHQLGLLHRDVKPQNVRVTPEGRVVLLDFGLVVHLRSAQTSDSGGGTAAYMAPEQWERGKICEATDLYGLGSLLYEALTGRPPFTGSSIEIMVQKDRGEPPPPRTLCAAVPLALDGLCARLLARSPEHRPSGPQVLDALGATGPSGPPRPSPPPDREELFVGRFTELSILTDSFDRARDTRLEVVLLEGESGMGKSALAHALVGRITEREPSLVVLESRCHAAEQVPFKMFDGLFDEVARYLNLLSPRECATLLPQNVGPLATLFPVLSSVEAIREQAARSGTAGVERFAVFRAASELLSAIASARPCLIVVDDAHFADLESMSLLRALLDSPHPTPALMLITVRRLETLEGGVAPDLHVIAQHPCVRRLRLGPLTTSETVALSAHCLGVDLEHPRARQVAAESQGHPLFASELSGRAAQGKSAASLDDALLERAARLGSRERRLLELLSVASAPISLKVLADASGYEVEQVERSTSALRGARLCRAVRRAELACYHDRVREALLSRLDPGTRRAHHAALANAYVRDKQRDPSVIAHHFLRAALDERATPWLARAAEEAMAKAAFEKAAQQYSELLERCATTTSHAERHGFQLALAEALSGAGRFAESARVLLSALPDAEPEQRHTLRVRAAQRMLQAGDVSAGLEAAELAVREAGLSWPRSTLSTTARLVFHRSYVSMRGLEAKKRGEDDVTNTVKVQLETLWRLWQPLMWADLLRGAELSARHLSLALREGPAEHAALALAGEALFIAVQHGDPRALAMIEHEQGAKESDELSAYRSFARGYVKFLLWDVAGAAADLLWAERFYRERCPSDAWMLTNVRSALLAAWFNLGEQQIMAEAAERWIAEAESREDRFALASCVVLGLGALRHIMNDEPERALSEVERAMAPYSTGSIGGQHLGELTTTASIQMYVGAGAPHAYWSETWPKIRSSFVGRARFGRELFDWCRADASLRLAATESGARRAALLKEARGLLSRGARAPVMQSLSAFGLAQIHALEGEHEAALSLATQANQRFREVGHYMHHSSGMLLAYLQGENVSGSSEAWGRWLASQGWVNPLRAMHMGLAIYPLIAR